MTVSFWEYRSEALGLIHEVALDALDRAEPNAALPKQDALELIEQICTESNLAYEDGGQVEDDELRRKLAAHYGEPRPLSWEQS